MKFCKGSTLMLLKSNYNYKKILRPGRKCYTIEIFACTKITSHFCVAAAESFTYIRLHSIRSVLEANRILPIRCSTYWNLSIKMFQRVLNLVGDSGWLQMKYNNIWNFNLQSTKEEIPFQIQFCIRLSKFTFKTIVPCITIVFAVFHF